MQLRISNAWLRVGKVIGEGMLEELSQPRIVGADQFALFFIWPKNRRYLTVEACGEAGPAGLAKAEFRTDAAWIENTLRAIGRPPDHFPAQVLRENWLLGGLVRRGQMISVKAIIDTNHSEYVHYVRQARSEPEYSPLKPLPPLLQELRLFYADAGTSTAGALSLVLENAGEIRPFHGAMALDLGNTNSTLTCLDAGKHHSSDLKVLPDVKYDFTGYEKEGVEQLGADPDRPTPSIVQIQKVLSREFLDRTPLGDDAKADLLDSPAAYQWEVGHSVGIGGYTSGVVVGPKRLVSRKEDQGIEIGAAEMSGPEARRMRRLPCAVPAELYICRLLQIFQAVAKQRPEALAITYPTTYTTAELDALRKTVYRALLRSRWRRQDSLGEDALREAIPLELDEASAAAFFFLHKKILEAPGGIHRFRYLHPQGFNLLLFDCGGGTTDIALVNARALDHKRLRITVLGRSGMRDFGGDDITEEIFLLLKAKLAFELRRREEGLVDRSLDPLPEPPRNLADDPAAWKTYLERYGRLIEKIVPTTFVPDSQAKGDIERQQNAIYLWRWAERVKHALREDKDQAKGLVQTGDLPQYLARGDDKKLRIINDEVLPRIAVSLAEVDSLIYDRVKHAVDCCNGLIQSKLQRWTEPAPASDGRSGAPAKGQGAEPHGAEQVDCVCVVGNASRYPLIRRLLKERLNAPGLDEEDAHLRRVLELLLEVRPLTSRWAELRTKTIPTHESACAQLLDLLQCLNDPELTEDKLRKRLERPHLAEPDKDRLYQVLGQVDAPTLTRSELDAVLTEWKVEAEDAEPLRMLLKQLNAAGLAEYERRFIYNERHLKYAVAKGASLALRLLRVRELVELEFASDLSRRLPFDVGYRYAPAQAPVRLYREGEYYEHLKEARVPPPQPNPAAGESAAQAQKIMNLLCRWPGEKAYAPFLRFHFPKGIQGEVRIRYDTNDHDFEAEDDFDIVRPTRAISDDIYRAPVQRGNL